MLHMNGAHIYLGMTILKGGGCHFDPAGSVMVGSSQVSYGAPEVRQQWMRSARERIVTIW